MKITELEIAKKYTRKAYIKGTFYIQYDEDGFLYVYLYNDIHNSDFIFKYEDITANDWIETI